MAGSAVARIGQCRHLPFVDTGIGPSEAKAERPAAEEGFRNRFDATAKSRAVEGWTESPEVRQGADLLQTVKPRRRKVDKAGLSKPMPMVKPRFRTKPNRSRQGWMRPGHGAARQFGTGPRDRPMSGGTSAGACAGRRRRCFRAVLKTPGVKCPSGPTRR